jgi:hypothetical protein
MQKQIFLLGCLFFLGITFGAAQWTQKKGTGFSIRLGLGF